MAYWKETAMSVWSHNLPNVQLYLASSCSRETDISDSRAVIGYVQCPYMTYSFQVTNVSTHKRCIEKWLRCMFESIICLLHLVYSSNPENRYMYL